MVKVEANEEGDSAFAAVEARERLQQLKNNTTGIGTTPLSTTTKVAKVRVKAKVNGTFPRKASTMMLSRVTTRAKVKAKTTKVMPT